MEIKVIAHRGSNREAPQNTLPAFRKAIEAGTDGFETDVHLSADGVPVICHNYTIDDTSDGSGEIGSYTLGELKKFDFGAYFSEEFRGTQLPTLDEFLDVAAPSEAEIINIELKCPSKQGMAPLVRKTVEAVRAYGIADRVIVSSFSPAILKLCKAAAPEIRTAFLYPTNRPSVCRPVFLNPFFIVRRVKADYIHPMAANVTAGLVQAAHLLGVGVNVWTVNDAMTVKRLAAFGVDGIITDCPGKVKELLNKKK